MYLPRAIGLVLLSVLFCTASLGDEETYPRAEPCAVAPSGMACIPGGTFIRGSDHGPEDTRPMDTVWLQTFYMDLFEVTYGEYQACVQAGKCAPAGPNYGDFNHPRQPITGVSWHDAVAYCRVQGKRLPTEAEWEKAARGTDGRRYPWGDHRASCELAVFKDRRGRSCGIPKKGKRPDKGRPNKVGSKPPQRYGLYDMAGNSWEWVHDWYSNSYAKCGEACRGMDPKGPCNGADSCPGHRRRVVRGGSWYWEAAKMTTFFRRAHVPSNSPFHHFGFRCAAGVQQAGYSSIQR